MESSASIHPWERFATDYLTLQRNTEKRYRGSLRTFFENYAYRKSVFDSMKRMSDRLVSSDFNVFRLLQRTTDENVISAVIADMLSPDGTHGQGRVFLDAFKDNVCASFADRIRHRETAPHPTTSWDEQVRVHLEYSTDKGRRIDIVVAFGQHFLLGIENKIHAYDQQNQVRDYLSYLESCGREHALLYLTPSGRRPCHSSISDEHVESKLGKTLFWVSYRGTIAAWLGECARQCESDRYRNFIKDFIECARTYAPLEEDDNGQ